MEKFANYTTSNTTQKVYTHPRNVLIPTRDNSMKEIIGYQDTPKTKTFLIMAADKYNTSEEHLLYILHYAMEQYSF